MFHARVVDEASARNDILGYSTNTKADHFTIVSASNMTDASVIGKLVDFINDCVEEGKIAYNKVLTRPMG